MEPVAKNTGFDPIFVRNMVESALRIGLIFVLLVTTYDIVRPFIVPLAWGGIIAIAHRSPADNSPETIWPDQQWAVADTRPQSKGGRLADSGRKALRCLVAGTHQSAGGHETDSTASYRRS